MIHFDSKSKVLYLLAIGYDTGMSQLLGDVLSSRNYGEPPEIRQIKEFVQTELGLTPAVSITSENYVVRLNSAAAAGALRSKLFHLQKQLNTSKRVVIRIG
jgi:hypothetical protein